MALLDDVKSELAAFEGDSPAAIKAQAAAMIRFGGGLRPVQNTYVIQAVFTSLDVAEWLKNTLRNTFGHEAEVWSPNACPMTARRLLTMSDACAVLSRKRLR